MFTELKVVHTIKIGTHTGPLCHTENVPSWMFSWYCEKSRWKALSFFMINIIWIMRPLIWIFTKQHFYLIHGPYGHQKYGIAFSWPIRCHNMSCETTSKLGPCLLTWINFNLSKSIQLHQLSSVRWNYLSIPTLQWLHPWSLEMDKQFHPTLHWACDYLSMLGSRLIHFRKRDPGQYLPPANHNKKQNICLTFGLKKNYCNEFPEQIYCGQNEIRLQSSGC